MDNKKAMIIEKWSISNKLALSEHQVSSLIQYTELVVGYSSEINLISKNDRDNIIERHLLDSLLALKVFTFPEGAQVADVGSGAGFPGLPIAIARPDLQMNLIESRRRRCLFLAKVVDSLRLANVNVINNRWENLNLQYDIILSRAFVNEAEAGKVLIPHLNPGGVVLYFAKFNQIKILNNS
jgi:16S rRNA (guanine527-N7)-methyltransferase